MTESQLQTRITKGLKDRGWLVNKPVTNSVNGLPDLHCYSPEGVTVFIEVKRAGEEPRPLQMYWIEKLKSMNFPVYVISTIKEMKGFFNEIDEKK